MTMQTFKEYLMETDDSSKITGLQGPHKARNGKIYYYAPAESKYFDPQREVYMNDQEFAEFQQSDI